jgi:hypothetical protein
LQGCIFWPSSPPPGRGGKEALFGEENRPLEKKNFRNKKIKIFYRKPFLNYNFSFKCNTLSFSFIIREAQFSFGKDNAQTTKALLNHTLGRKSPNSNILFLLIWGSKLSLS